MGLKELEKLEELLEKKVETEANRGVKKISRGGVLSIIFLRLKLFFLKIWYIVEGEDYRHLVMGAFLGFSIVLSIFVAGINPIFGFIIMLFMFIYSVLSYPEMLKLISNYFSHVVFGLARRGSIITITTPKEIKSNMRSVEFVLLIFVWGIPLIMFTSNIIISVYVLASSVIVGLTSIAYYYLSMALKCWEDPFRKITEKDLFSKQFLIFIFLFASSITDLYLFASVGFESLFSWLTVFLTYLFLSAIMAIPSFQAAIYVTVKWRRSGIQALINEITNRVS